MSYKIIIAKLVLKELLQLSRKENAVITTAIDNLAEEPRPNGSKKLKGQKENLYRIRSGDYRIIYAIDDAIKIIEVRKIGHRKDIYQ